MAAQNALFEQYEAEQLRALDVSFKRRAADEVATGLAINRQGKD